MSYTAHQLRNSQRDTKQHKNAAADADLEQGILDELAKVIAYNPKEVAACIIASGVEIEANAKPKKIVAVLKDNLHKNEFLRKNITTLLIRKDEATVSGDGKAAEALKNPQVQESISTILAGIIGSAKNVKDKRKARQAQTNLGNLEKKVQNIQNNTDNKEGMKKTTKFIIYGVIGAAVLVGGYYLVRYLAAKKAKKMAEGGEVGGGTEPVVQQTEAVPTPGTIPTVNPTVNQ